MTCTCDPTTCQNRPPPPPSVEKTTEAPIIKDDTEDEKETSSFLPELCIVSWNLCHFSVFLPSSSSPRYAGGGKTLEEFVKRHAEEVDLFVFQEFPKADIVPAFYDIFTKRGYEHDSLGEHLFVWKKDSLRPIRHLTNMYARSVLHRPPPPFVEDGGEDEGSVPFIRDLTTMRFHATKLDRMISVTSVHLHSEEKQALASFRYLMDTYDDIHAARFGRDAVYEQIILGDFNLNLHHLRKEDGKEKWILSGHETSVTTGGGKGVDWLLLRRSSSSVGGRMNLAQRIIPLRQPKNARKSIPGISDHHPILYYMSYLPIHASTMSDVT
jgi:hypothetical protein